MTESFPNWLTKRMLRGVRGFNIDAYLMALEGWRRGLTLTWYADPEEVTNMKIIGFHPLGKTFSLQAGNKGERHFFYRSRGDKVANEAVDIVHQKHEAKKYFDEAGVPTPKGISFDRETDNHDIIERIQSLSYPLVVKPVLGSLGKGVTTNIQNETELLDAINYVQDRYDDYDQYIVEEHFEGEEYRVYVVGDEVVAATKRVPANVIGDGVSTIEQLVEKKNIDRKENPYLNRKLIKLDETVVKYLEQHTLTILDIPEKGEVIRLKGQANISAGGDPIDATDIISDEVREIAVSAVKAIPNLLHAGVDIISNGKEHTVIEVNATADVAMHVFPIDGLSRNVFEQVIDFYFPETKEAAKGKSIYFDYKGIINRIQERLASEITLSDAPKGQLYTARYIVSGKVQKVGYRNWIRSQAIKNGLHGYTRNLKNGNVVVVVGGGNQHDVENFENICSKGPRRASVERVKRLKWNVPIRLGFEIRKSN